MRILQARERTVPLGGDIRNAYIDFRSMTTSIVALTSDVIRNGKPLVGYGFNSNGRYGVGGILRERMLARLLAAAPETLTNSGGTNFEPERIWKVLMTNEKPGGHGDRAAAVGVVDMAVWDLVAKIDDRPLYAILADRQGVTPDPRVAVYAAGGYYRPGKDFEGLTEEIRGYLESGYTAVKIKIGGASLDDDMRRIEAVLALVDGPHLAVDANGRFDLRIACDYAAAMKRYHLRWYEEAGDPLDFELQSQLAKAYDGPLATGENLFSLQDARNLIRYAGMRPDRDILQFDPALAYGIVEYLRILDMLAETGWSPRRCIPHGGHQMALHVAAGAQLGGNEAYPGVFEPFGGFADNTPVENGFVMVPDAPGIGFELKANLYELFTSLA
jgi:L-alanine-DL-glutamate epimerase-like enolase superfamily enzyme